MSVRLETLELTPAELAAAREAIQKIAYFNWLAAGSPAGQDAKFWGQADRQWIERHYVPSRPLDGTRPEPEATPAMAVEDAAQPPQEQAFRPRETVEAR